MHGTWSHFPWNLIIEVLIIIFYVFYTDFCINIAASNTIYIVDQNLKVNVGDVYMHETW